MLYVINYIEVCKRYVKRGWFYFKEVVEDKD